MTDEKIINAMPKSYIKSPRTITRDPIAIIEQMREKRQGMFDYFQHKYNNQLEIFSV